MDLFSITTTPKGKIMISKKIIVVWLVACLFLLVSCVHQADFDIRGEWEYTMITTDGNTYDMGTITFEGEPAQGTYLEINIYQVEYKGEFTVRGTVLKLIGDETWAGTISDAKTLSGTWSHTDGASGTFTAKRK
jgi:hypothetical protein